MRWCWSRDEHLWSRDEVVLVMCWYGHVVVVVVVVTVMLRLSARRPVWWVTDRTRSAPSAATPSLPPALLVSFPSPSCGRSRASWSKRCSSQWSNSRNPSSPPPVLRPERRSIGGEAEEASETESAQQAEKGAMPQSGSELAL